jgi:hypothetical protein
MAAKLSRHGFTGRTIAPPSLSPPTSAPRSFIASMTCASPTRERYTGHPKLAATSSTMRLVEMLATTAPALRSSQRRMTSTTVASVPSGAPCSSTMASRSASASWTKPTSAPELRTSPPSSARLASSGSGFGRHGVSAPALMATTSHAKASSSASTGTEAAPPLGSTATLNLVLRMSPASTIRVTARR